MNKIYCRASWYGRDDLTPEDIGKLWALAKHEKVLDVVFYDGLMDEQRFLNFVLSEANNFAVVYQMIEGQEQMLAFVWLNGQAGKSGMIHFGFLRAGLPYKLEIGKQVLDWCWAGGLESLVALTPSYNAPAISFGRQLGGELLGVIPGACPLANREAASGAFILFQPR